MFVRHGHFMDIFMQYLRSFLQGVVLKMEK